MTSDDIEKLIEADESRTLELEKSTGELKDGMHAVCAFLWGSGILRIIEACREQGVEDPTWRWDGAFVYVTFKRPSKDTDDPQNDNLGGHAGQFDHPKKSLEGQNDHLKSADDLIKEFVIARINETPTISREELADISNTSESTLKRRMKEWNIVWEGHSKTGHWVIPQ